MQCEVCCRDEDKLFEREGRSICDHCVVAYRRYLKIYNNGFEDFIKHRKRNLLKNNSKKEFIKNKKEKQKLELIKMFNNPIIVEKLK